MGDLKDRIGLDAVRVEIRRTDFSRYSNLVFFIIKRILVSIFIFHLFFFFTGE